MRSGVYRRISDTRSESYSVDIFLFFNRHGAPLPNKTGHSCRNGDIGHDQPFENVILP